jgi:type IV pilus assembly protein PilN
MRNIESSPWLATPELVEIKSVPLDKQKINEFTLNLQVKRLGDPNAPGAPGKAPGAPAAKGGKV